jgi:hypothetical protein
MAQVDSSGKDSEERLRKRLMKRAQDKVAGTNARWGSYSRWPKLRESKARVEGKKYNEHHCTVSWDFLNLFFVLITKSVPTFCKGSDSVKKIF